MRNEGENIVCALCLKSSECALENVGAVTKEMLKTLGLDLDSDVNGICTTCSDNLEKCSDFKIACLYTESCINSFKNDRSNVKLDLREIYLRKNEHENIAVPKCTFICRLCMEIVEADGCMSLSGETKDSVLAKILLRRCFSELDLDTIKNPVICASCTESLDTYFSFIKNHLHIKDEVKEYCKLEEISNKPQVKANSGLQFEPENISNYKNGCYSLGHKNCSETELYDEPKLKPENLLQGEIQEVHIKREVGEQAEVDDVEVEKLSNLIKKFEDKQNSTGLKHEDFVEAETREFNIKHEEVDIKAERCDVTRVHLKQDTKTTKTAHYCGICTYETKQKGNLNQHMLTHRNTSQVTMYSCEICTYKAKRKEYLRKHMVIHKSASEITVYHCDFCTLKTRRREVLKRHILIHKTASEASTYQCHVCNFTTRYKGVLIRHVLIHRDASEVAKLKDRYAMRHKPDSYQCDVCTFKTKYKSVLRHHVLIHKNESEVAMYSCAACTFVTNRKDILKQHMLTHKNPSQVTMYSCEMCTYKAKRKGDLSKHMLTHKKTSEVTTYQCDLCTFKTRYKNNVKQHVLIHKNDSEVTTYSCAVCTYKAKRKGDLRQHMQIHKKTAEIRWNLCEICSYKTKRMGHFNKHMKIHENSSERTYHYLSETQL